MEFDVDLRAQVENTIQMTICGYTAVQNACQNILEHGSKKILSDQKCIVWIYGECSSEYIRAKQPMDANQELQQI